ncbi:acetate--CoA ligase family protein [Paraburkholderia xenovorans]
MAKSKRTGSELAKALLSPTSVALIGISDDPSKTSGRPLAYNRKAGYEGTIYPVAKRDTVQGEQAWKSVADLPAVPEHAFILTPTDAAIDALEECAKLGVPVATILAAGFSESGPEGVAREARVREIVERTGIRLLGPSGLGMVNVREKLALTANAAFAEPDLPVGGVFVASHSGSMIGALLSRGKEKGIGFAGLISMGNEVDLSVGEVCSATLDDPQITGYMLFLETMRHAEKLREFALEAAKRGKPVVAFKLGRSDAAAELAVSHTGALAGEDDVADTFLRDCGIARVETLEAFLEALPLAARVALPAVGTIPKKPRVAVVTTTGGGAAMVVDQLGMRAIDVVHPSDETYARLAEAGVSVGHGRIVDLTLAGTKYDVMMATLDVLRTAPEFDLVVAVAGSSARFSPELVVRPVIDQTLNPKSPDMHPLCSFVVPEAPKTLQMLTQAGVPCFRTPEGCGDAIAAVYARRPPKARAQTRTPGTVTTTLDEAESYAVLEQYGVPHARFQTLSAEPDASFKLNVDYPVAVKALTAALPHKTEAGGVELGILSETELRAAINRIRAAVASYDPSIQIDRVLVQQMSKGVGEALVGYRLDPQVGPVVMLAAGGVLTEIYRDRALRTAPVDKATALEMISEVKMFKALAGYRGKVAGDLDALAGVVVAMSNLATFEGGCVIEAEVNPVMIFPKGKGVKAVDALILKA